MKWFAVIALSLSVFLALFELPVPPVGQDQPEGDSVTSLVICSVNRWLDSRIPQERPGSYVAWFCALWVPTDFDDDGRSP